MEATTLSQCGDFELLVEAGADNVYLKEDATFARDAANHVLTEPFDQDSKWLANDAGGEE